MRLRTFLWLIVAVSLMSVDAFAQSGTISGTAVEFEDGTPLPGVNVFIQGTQQGSATDANGAYTIPNVAPGTYNLVATFVGYDQEVIEGVQVVAGQTTNVDFAMVPAEVELDEVTVVGYGVQRSEDVTGAVATIDLENIRSLPLVSLDEALQGQVAGVNVISATGVPGGGPAITIRGGGNIGAGGQPLYVVDGFALDQPSDNQAMENNPLATIPPDDIESITILKDASATAIYGSRASNGVVIVTTKSGQAGQLDFNISANVGMNQTMDRMHLDLSNAREFLTFQNRIYQGKLEAGNISEAEFPEMYRNPEAYTGPDTDWFDEITRTARQVNLQAAVSGGSDRLRSYFSAGYTREEGVMMNTDFNRFSLRANLETNLSDRIMVGLRLAPSLAIRHIAFDGGSGRGGGPGGVPWMACPAAPVRLDDGSLLPQIGRSGIGDEGIGGCPGTWSFPNPVMAFEEINTRNQTLRTLTNAYLNFEVIDGLTLNQSFNVDYGTGESTSFEPSIVGSTNNPPPVVPEGEFSSSTSLNWLAETTLNFARRVGPGNLDLLGGFTAQRQINRGSDISGDFPNDDIRTLNVAFDVVGSATESEWALMSTLARANYNLMDRYVFTATVRSDGSSRFGEINRWGTFPSGAVAWNIHNEPFMDGVAVPELRARLSYGVTGNNSIGNYASLGTISETNYLFGGSFAPGRTLGSMGNAALAWEKTQEFNLGFDLALHNYRLRMAVELYQSLTSNLLLDRDLPSVAGFGAVDVNQGELRNRGIEFTMNSINIAQDNLSWSTDFNIALNRNQITSLPGGNDITYGGGGPIDYVHKEGLPMATFIGYIVDGLYQGEDPTARNHFSNAPSNYSGAGPGQIIFRDLNGDGVLTEEILAPNGDYAIITDAWPDFTIGLTNTLSIGRFDIRALFTGSFGGNNFRGEFYRTSRNIDGLFLTDSEYVKNMWVSPEQPGDGLTPTAYGGGAGDAAAFNRQQYRDAAHTIVAWDNSYMWLRNLTLRYNLPPGVAGTRSANVYLTGSNLFVITSYPGNPDVTDQSEINQQPGVDFGNYPIPRSFTFGVELGL